MEFQKYNIKEKKKKREKKNTKVTKIIKYIYIYMKFDFKNRAFFCKVIVGYNNES